MKSAHLRCWSRDAQCLPPRNHGHSDLMGMGREGLLSVCLAPRALIDSNPWVCHSLPSACSTSLSPHRSHAPLPSSPQQPLSTPRHYSTAHCRVVSTQAATRPSGSDPTPSTVTSQQVSSSAPQPPQASPTQQPSRQVRYSPLHYNVEDFVQRVVPTDDEKKYKQHIVDLVRSHTRKTLSDYGRVCDVQVFGSFATGLSTWASDVDLVVTGVMAPDRYTGVYSVDDRGRVVGRLRRIGEALRRCKKLEDPRISIISRAKMPIIKLKVRNVMLDISIGDDTGPRVARYMAQQVRAFPPMRPLVLVLKAYLRSVGLNEVLHGGLSSYSLCNMVIAHLQEELKAGRDIMDLGEVLYAFLLRYGEEFDYGRDAVSVEMGGVVPKAALGFQNDFNGSRGYPELDRHYERLAVDCPVTGRDVSNGTYRIDAVRQAFQRAARRLEALARGRKVDDLSLNYLQALFDVNRVVKRTANDLFDYEDDFIQVMGRGTSPEIIQLGRERNEEFEEEVLANFDFDPESTSLTSAGDEAWDDSDTGAGQTQGKSGRHRGGPRGKGVKGG